MNRTNSRLAALIARLPQRPLYEMRIAVVVETRCRAKVESIANFHEAEPTGENVLLSAMAEQADRECGS